jgi:hypothetical protein
VTRRGAAQPGPAVGQPVTGHGPALRGAEGAEAVTGM